MLKIMHFSRLSLDIQFIISVMTNHIESLNCKLQITVVVKYSAEQMKRLASSLQQYNSTVDCKMYLES